jgi:hypothetical protein
MCGGYRSGTVIACSIISCTSRGVVPASNRALNSTRSGSLSGVTAHWSSTPFGIMIRSAPLTSVV